MSEIKHADRISRPEVRTGEDRRVVLKTRGPLERSTARRETAMPGSAGSAGRASLPAGAGAARENSSGGLGSAGATADARLQRARNKPKKLYDQKAESMAKTLASRKASEAKAGKKGLSDNGKLLLAAGILVVVGLGLYISIPRVTVIRQVTVNGMMNVTQAEIVDSLGITGETNLVNADLNSMKASVGANPKVASVDIRRSFPDTLVVNLVERAPVACVLVNDETGTRSIAIDENGVAFAYLDLIGSSDRLPVLSGIRFERFVPGQRLPEYLVPLMGDIARLSREAPETLGAFSEIKIEKIAESEAELLLYPSSTSVPIRMPARLSRASLASALLVLDILASRTDSGSVEEVDFRTGTIVYRTKEAQAG